ncbi:MAG: putative MFS-type transporter [Propionibacteriaceae bacterium]|nr:putative MFS-type transporter [Propionibacteriaceae bacterium]
MTATTSPPSPARVRSATYATYLAFIAAGVAFASWASRIPQVRDALLLTPATLGLVLLASAAGSVISLPLSGPVITRIGSRRTLTVMSILTAMSLAGVAIGYHQGRLSVVIALFFLGIGYGSWDVAMNVQGATVERLLGRAIMSRFHAGFSVGTVAGALIGTAMVALEVSVTTHLLVVAVALSIAVPIGVRSFVSDTAAQEEAVDAAAAPTTPDAPRSALSAWRERRTILIGIFVLAFAFAEGTGNDWVAIALIDGYGATAVIGTLGFAVFLAAMTAGRWFGPAWLNRYGRVAVNRALTGASLVGLALFIFGQNLPIAFVGAALWGFGISLGFPVGMSAGADEPAMAAARVSVIASIGYCAFLAGPPLIGFIGEQVTVLRAMVVVAAVLAVAFLIAGNLRPPTSSRQGT